MPPTAKRILKAGLPAAVVLAVVGYGLAELADLFLAANAPVREVEVTAGDAPAADPLPAKLKATLPVSMALWGFAIVAGYEGLRRLVKGPPARPKVKPPAVADVDRLLTELAAKTGVEVATPPPVGSERARV